MILKRFRFIDPHGSLRAARDEHCERKFLLRARGTDHRQSYSTHSHLHVSARPAARNNLYVSVFSTSKRHWRLLSRPAPPCKNQSPYLGSAPKQARQFECLITFRAWGHQASKLQGVRCADVAVTPVR
jgi:hypothetical protein